MSYTNTPEFEIAVVGAGHAGVEAALAALKEAGLAPEDVTHLFVATCTPEHLSPSTSCVIAGKLGILCRQLCRRPDQRMPPEHTDRCHTAKRPEWITVAQMGVK